MKRSCKFVEKKTDLGLKVKFPHVIHITGSKNNLRVAVSSNGKLLRHTSHGRSHVTGVRRRTPHVISTYLKIFCRQFLFKYKNLKDVHFVASVSGDFNFALETLIDEGFKIVYVDTARHFPFNGCRRKKGRRGRIRTKKKTYDILDTHADSDTDSDSDNGSDSDSDSDSDIDMSGASTNTSFRICVL
jgi:ribosomal protein S11